MHPVLTESADRRVVWGSLGFGRTQHTELPQTTRPHDATDIDQPHGRHVALDYKTLLIEEEEERRTQREFVRNVRLCRG
jgi:hypothetical protein